MFSQVSADVYAVEGSPQRRGTVAGMVAGGGLAGLFAAAAGLGYANVGHEQVRALGEVLWQVIGWGTPVLILVLVVVSKLKRVISKLTQ
ncbi:MAG: hypothetical protein ACRDT6_16795 [Micromonosporaceae bacterium]